MRTRIYYNPSKKSTFKNIQDLYESMTDFQWKCFNHPINIDKMIEVYERNKLRIEDMIYIKKRRQVLKPSKDEEEQQEKDEFKASSSKQERLKEKTNMGRRIKLKSRKSHKSKLKTEEKSDHDQDSNEDEIEIKASNELKDKKEKEPIANNDNNQTNALEIKCYQTLTGEQLQSRFEKMTSIEKTTHLVLQANEIARLHKLKASEGVLTFTKDQLCAVENPYNEARLRTRDQLTNFLTFHRDHCPINIQEVTDYIEYLGSWCNSEDGHFETATNRANFITKLVNRIFKVAKFEFPNLDFIVSSTKRGKGKELTSTKKKDESASKEKEKPMRKESKISNKKNKGKILKKESESNEEEDEYSDN